MAAKLLLVAKTQRLEEGSVKEGPSSSHEGSRALSQRSPPGHPQGKQLAWGVSFQNDFPGAGSPGAGHAGGQRAGCRERGGARPQVRRVGEAAAAVVGSRTSDVFLGIRRRKTTIFTEAKESSTVFEPKRIVEGILKRPPNEQRLYKDDQLLDDGKTLGEWGFTSQTAGPQAPATVGLAFRAEDVFEALRLEPFPPELPGDSGSSASEQAVH
ncbi:LOW QUALITY PROTEIN: elongin-B-like [Molossus nigricans]